MTFFGLPTLESAEKEMARLQGGISSYNRTVLMFIIIHREDQIPIGVCGYHNWYQPHRRAEIGYMMHNIAYREKGLMKEALQWAVHYGFNTMNLHRIEAFVGRNNTPSLKLLNGLGFQYEGTLREHYMVNGVPDDSLVYGLLKQELTTTTG